MTDNIDINEIQKLQDFYLQFCEDNLLNDLEHSGFYVKMHKMKLI